jgi:predicted Na+-dependent transporter
VVALQRPELVSWFHGEEVTRTLSLTMLGMGLTTPLSQFNSVLQIPKAVVAGVFLQYTIMPFFG